MEKGKIRARKVLVKLETRKERLGNIGDGRVRGRGDDMEKRGEKDSKEENKVR